MIRKSLFYTFVLFIVVLSRGERTSDNLGHNLDEKEEIIRSNRSKRDDIFQRNELNDCGKSQVVRPVIVGGNLTVRGEYPWKTALVTKSGKFFCGGTLVSNNLVVTAAHCIHGKHNSHEFKPEDIVVLLGVYDISRTNEIGRITSNVKTIRLHPDWNVEVDSYDADVAILVLETEIQFNSYIQPICLDGQHSKISKAVSGVAVGFGKTETGKISNIAKKLSVPIMDYHECSRKKDTLQYLLSSRTFCGGPGDGRGVCEGDSGSGLYIPFNNRFYLRGIASASTANSINECDVNTYSVFTDVTDYCGWIKSGGLVEHAICIKSDSTNVTLRIVTGPSKPTVQPISNQSKPSKNILYGGECLKANEFIESENKCFKLVYQNDGDLAYFRKSSSQSAWSSLTPGSCTNRACMQEDGNFVIYNCNDKPIFVTQTVGHPGSRIILQNDGNLVIYDLLNVVLWASHTTYDCGIKDVVHEPQTSPTLAGKQIKNILYAGECLEANEYLESVNKCFRFRYQSDGDLVHYRKSTMHPLWRSLTPGSCTYKACMQDDGNFVVYDCNGKPTFVSNTVGHPGSKILLQDDGNLVIYDLKNTPLWATHTVMQC